MVSIVVFNSLNVVSMVVFSEPTCVVSIVVFSEGAFVVARCVVLSKKLVFDRKRARRAGGNFMYRGNILFHKGCSYFMRTHGGTFDPCGFPPEK